MFILTSIDSLVRPLLNFILTYLTFMIIPLIIDINEQTKSSNGPIDWVGTGVVGRIL